MPRDRNEDEEKKRIADGQKANAKEKRIQSYVRQNCIVLERYCQIMSIMDTIS